MILPDRGNAYATAAFRILISLTAHIRSREPATHSMIRRFEQAARVLDNANTGSYTRGHGRSLKRGPGRDWLPRPLRELAGCMSTAPKWALSPSTLATTGLAWSYASASTVAARCRLFSVVDTRRQKLLGLHLQSLSSGGSAPRSLSDTQRALH